MDYVKADTLAARARVEFVELPWPYKPGAFLASYRHARARLAELIRRCEYLCFAIGGTLRDWATVAAFEAVQQRRPFSVWTDSVEYRVIRHSHADRKGLRKVYRLVRDGLVMSPVIRLLHQHIIRRSDLGLFHGRDCFDAYAPYSRSPHLVHDIHLKPADRIGSDALRRKLERIRSGQPLRLVYCGRMIGLKGPFDWLDVMSALRTQGLAFHAAWVGDGPLLRDMQDELKRRDLATVVDLPGFVSNRSDLLQAMRDADVFVFCHKTSESPRCLIEALTSACPIVGYASSYAQDLVGDLAGRLLVDRNDVRQLAGRIVHFDRHRDELAEMVRRSHDIGANFSDEAVFQHRSALIKSHLGFTTEPQHVKGDEGTFGGSAEH